MHWNKTFSFLFLWVCCQKHVQPVILSVNHCAIKDSESEGIFAPLSAYFHFISHCSRVCDSRTQTQTIRGYPGIAAWMCSETGTGEEPCQICTHRSNTTNGGTCTHVPFTPKKKIKDSNGRLRELVSPDSPLGHREIGAHLCHRQWGSSLCVTLLGHCWYRLVRASSYTHWALLL